MSPYPLDLAFIREQATLLKDDNEAFCYYIEDDDLSDAELDALVEALAAPIIAAIDCQQCANCCRALDVYLTPEDAERLAAGLCLSSIEFTSRYLDQPRAQAEGEWGMFKHKPCVFLRDKSCSVYAQRPESCRAYPAFTPDFRWQIRPIMAGVGVCPIIYHLIQALKTARRW